VALVSEGLVAAIPELGAARFARAWAGILPFTSDNLPIIGPVPGYENLVVAAGHVFGNGAGPTTGRLVADLLCGTEPALDMTLFRSDRPGLEPVAGMSVW
jgi:glycine/D-amino acid oxidase-like deaminating enzyme